MEKDERKRGWEERAEERRTGSKKAWSNMSKRALWLSWLWSVAHTLTQTHTRTHTKLCDTCAIHPPTHTHPIYPGKKNSPPLGKHIQCTCRSMPLWQGSAAHRLSTGMNQLDSHANTHAKDAQYKSSHTFKTHLPSACLSEGGYSQRAENCILMSHLWIEKKISETETSWVEDF